MQRTLASPITGASAYPVVYQPMQLFLSSATGGLTEDTTSGAPSGTWTTQTLPERTLSRTRRPPARR